MEDPITPTTPFRVLVPPTRHLAKLKLRDSIRSCLAMQRFGWRCDALNLDHETTQERLENKTTL